MNSIATKDNSILIENSRTMKQVKTKLSRQTFQRMSRPRQIYVVTQHSEPGMGDKKTLSRQRSFISQQTQHEAEVNSIATKTNIVMTEVEKITNRMSRHRVQSQQYKGNKTL